MYSRILNCNKDYINCNKDNIKIGYLKISITITIM